MAEWIEMTVGENVGIRLDKYLADQLTDYTRSFIQKQIEQEGVKVNNQIVNNKYKVKNPWDIYKYYMDSLRYLKKEIFKVVLLNTKSEIITDVDVSVGTLNSSLVHPREVFTEAIKRSANKIILMHNHPSGSIEPSVEDKNITKRLINCGEIIGIEVIDHIIIGDGVYFSFKENMLI